MQKIMKCLMAVVMIVMTMTGCDKLPEDGDLDGNWQLLTITTADGTTTDVKAERIFWAERNGLVEYTNCTTAKRYFSHCMSSGNKLIIKDFFFTSEHETAADDNPAFTVDDLPELFPFGIHATVEGTVISETFDIEHLDASKMILHSSSATLVFRKF